MFGWNEMFDVVVVVPEVEHHRHDILNVILVASYMLDAHPSCIESSIAYPIMLIRRVSVYCRKGLADDSVVRRRHSDNR
jgi:hypothetical protein